MNSFEYFACFCVGPDPGETLCPCQLRLQALKGKGRPEDLPTPPLADHDSTPERTPDEN